MRKIVKKIISRLCSLVSLHRIVHGTGCLCNFMCKFTRKTRIGNDCHFNGMRIYGDGLVSFGDHFHSGKNIKILTTFHDYDHGTKLPYDDGTYSRDVVIDEYVWLGDDVLILGGVKIGEGAVIQAGSVVCKDIPPFSVCGGHPAVPFKYRNMEHYNEIVSKTWRK